MPDRAPTGGPRRWLGWVVLCALAAACVGVLAHVAQPRTADEDCPVWEEGTRCGAWRLAFDGFGEASGTQGAGGWRYRLAPRAVDEDGETSAALALSEAEFDDLDLSVRLRTVEQLRRPAGNPWEVAWLLWHHSDDQHFYYVALKPNGWEVGKADPAYPGAQRFLASGNAPAFPVGRWYRVQVHQIGRDIQVRVDDAHLARVRDTERPYTSGAVGLYTEDASVEFEDIRLGAVEPDQRGGR